MSTNHRALVAKKACSRCSTQKRRCDKALPRCELCTRLRQVCKYESPQVLSPSLTPSPSPRSELFLNYGVFTANYLRDAATQNFGLLTPEDILSAYSQIIEPWFPIISISKLRSQLPTTWDDAPLDFVLLCLSIRLLIVTPPSSPEDDSNPSEFKYLYFHTKNCIASTEVLGINSFLVVQSRILVTLFEVAHGFHMAAYISIGATVRAADALGVDSGLESTISHSSADLAKQEETVLIWCGILILDRYITIESGPNPSITRSRSQFFVDALKPIVCPIHQFAQDRTSPISRLARLFEASALLDKIHTTLNSPTAEHAFNMEELILVVQTCINLQTILNNETLESGETHIYVGGLGLVNIALLLAFENGTKVPPIPGAADSCNSIATISLISILSSITSTTEPFILGAQPIDFNRLPPFMSFLIYKAAGIVTERIIICVDSEEGLKKLRVLRGFLKKIGERWLSGERYLKLLDEDTTPRILKAIERE